DEYNARQEAMITAMHSFFQKRNLSTKPGDRFDHTAMRVEINCAKNAARSIFIGDYDFAGTLLNSVTLEGETFAPFAKGSNAAIGNRNCAHSLVVWTTATFRRDPVDQLVGIHDVAGLAMYAV